MNFCAINHIYLIENTIRLDVEVLTVNPFTLISKTLQENYVLAIPPVTILSHASVNRVSILSCLGDRNCLGHASAVPQKVERMGKRAFGAHSLVLKFVKSRGIISQT